MLKQEPNKKTICCDFNIKNQHCFKLDEQENDFTLVHTFYKNSFYIVLALKRS